MKESNLHRAIMLAASRAGHRLFRNNVGALKDGRGVWVRYGVGGNGGSDLIGWTRDGRFVAIEVKVEKGKPTEQQLAFVEAAKSMGCVAGVVWSVEEAMGLLG